MEECSPRYPEIFPHNSQKSIIGKRSSSWKCQQTLHRQNHGES